jgi:carbon monoxide dehydrogenase subunit G
MQLQHSFTVPAGIEQAWQVLLDIERIAPCMPGAALDTVDGDDFTGSVKVRLGPIGLTYKGKASFVEKDAAEHRAVIDAQGKDARGNGTAKAVITATLTEQGTGTAVNVVTDLNITGKPAQFGRGVMVDVGNKLIGQFADCLAGKLSGPDEGSVGETELVDGQPGLSDSGVTATAPVPYLTESTVSEPAAEPLPPTTLEPDLPADAMPETAVLAVPAAALDEVTVEPDAAAEQAPPAQRPADVAPGQPAARLSQRPSPDEVEPIDLLGSAGPALAKRLAPVLAGVLLAVVLLRRLRRSQPVQRTRRRRARA